jgi:alpha-L-fucosidase 2
MKRVNFNKIIRSGILWSGTLLSGLVLGMLAVPCAGFAQSMSPAADAEQNIGPATSAAQSGDYTLWYRQPAVKWTDALPIGNGLLGAMIYGGARTEHIQFNEATLWTDGPRAYQRPGAGKYLDSIRDLLFRGRQAEAEALAEEHFMGAKNHDEHQYAALKDQWFDKVRADTSGADPATDDRSWARMSLPTPNGWETAGMEGIDGAVWFRTSFILPKGWAGKNLVLDLGKIRDADFTYLNGKLVGRGEGISTKRRYIVDASVLREGLNVLSVQVINYFDKGGLVGVKNKQPTLFVAPAGDEEHRVSLKGTWKYWIQDEDPPPFPRYEASYQPFGDVWLRFHGEGQPGDDAGQPAEAGPRVQSAPSDYRRQLDLPDAIEKVEYTASGVKYTREYFASLPGKAIVLHLGASRPGSISLSASFNTPHRLHAIRQVDGSTIALSVQVKDGVMKGVSYLHASVVHGTIRVMGDSLIIGGADEVTFYLVAATNFNSYKDVSGNPEARCRSALQGLTGKAYAELRADHIREYQSYFGKFSIDLGQGKNQDLPADERIRAFNNANDPGLIALYVQYARYLLISSSRAAAQSSANAAGDPAAQPANLQGIWNDQLTPSWGSKYTTNINLEMNYWPSEVLNLSRCAQPLFALTDQVAEAGRATAKDYYGAPGWVLHHNTDLWRGTAPIDASTNGIWVTGGAWLCHQVWEHFLFTGDTAFLRAQYPIMKGAADFFEHFLVKDPRTGWLISTPSNSPEHGGLVAGPTMDHQIIRDLLGNCISAAEILHTDAPLRATWADTRARIAPNQIGKYGQLQEWMEDKDDTADQHRHVSHLWGVFPGTDITWKDSALMKAARQSLIYRGPDGTGWSIAWKADLWARFRDGERALEMIDKLLSPADDGVAEKGGVYNNLFDAHPPFQIDGNFGGAAGVAEMLLQSQNGYIDLLPALPGAWKQGEVKGICARGGFVLDIRWAENRLRNVTVRSLTGGECVLVYGGTKVRFATRKGRVYRLDGTLKVTP